jgi:hypothetical protein
VQANTIACKRICGEWKLTLADRPKAPRKERSQTDGRRRMAHVDGCPPTHNSENGSTAPKRLAGRPICIDSSQRLPRQEAAEGRKSGRNKIAMRSNCRSGVAHLSCNQSLTGIHESIFEFNIITILLHSPPKRAQNPIYFASRKRVPATVVLNSALETVPSWQPIWTPRC